MGAGHLEVFNALKLEQTKLTLVTMTMQDHATLKEIKDLAKNITQQYGTPDLCIEGMRKKNLKTMLFISQLKAKTNFQVVGITMNCFSPLCKNASRMDQKLRAPVPMTWAFMMREAGFPAVRPIYELPLSEDVRKRLVRTVLIFTESSDQLSRATDRVPGLPASPGYVQ